MRDIEYLRELTHEAEGDGMPVMSMRIAVIADHYKAMYEILQKLGEIEDCDSSGDAMDSLMNLLMSSKPQELLAKIEGGE